MGPILVILALVSIGKNVVTWDGELQRTLGASRDLRSFVLMLKMREKWKRSWKYIATINTGGRRQDIYASDSDFYLGGDALLSTLKLSSTLRSLWGILLSVTRSFISYPVLPFITGITTVCAFAYLPVSLQDCESLSTSFLHPYHLAGHLALSRCSINVW